MADRQRLPRLLAVIVTALLLGATDETRALRSREQGADAVGRVASAAMAVDYDARGVTGLSSPA